MAAHGETCIRFDGTVHDRLCENRATRWIQSTSEYPSVYVMPDPGLNGAVIGGDAIAQVCIRKPSGSVRPAKGSVPAAKL
jgi:hypothetical protein